MKYVLIVLSLTSFFLSFWLLDSSARHSTWRAKHFQNTWLEMPATLMLWAGVGVFMVLAFKVYP